MTLEEAQARIVARMSADERKAFKSGCTIVDWLMDIAVDDHMPASVREDARRKLRACAHRKPDQTVQDVIGIRQ